MSLKYGPVLRRVELEESHSDPNPRGKLQTAVNMPNSPHKPTHAAPTADNQVKYGRLSRKVNLNLQKPAKPVKLRENTSDQVKL